jgi:hypothetical protein
VNDDILNRVEIQIKKTYYIHDRYNTLSTFGLLYCEKEISEKELAKFLRVSDKFFKLDNNTYFINFDYTSEEKALKASQNLILHLDNFFNNSSSCVAIDEFNTTYIPQTVLSRLQQILGETRKSSYSRVEDESILSEVF